MPRSACGTFAPIEREGGGNDLARATSARQRSVFGSRAVHRFSFRPPRPAVRPRRRDGVVRARAPARHARVRFSHPHGSFRGLRSPVAAVPPPNRPLHLVGPAGFLDQVEHKLRAYNWNLLDEDSLDFVLTAAEFTAGGVGGVCGFRAREAFRRRELALPPLAPGTLLDEEEFRIESVVLDHGTPCLALAFQEKLRINVWREGLDLLELPVGPWLNEAKRAVRRGAPDDSRILIRDDRFVPLGVLKQHALRSAPGDRIV